MIVYPLADRGRDYGSGIEVGKPGIAFTLRAGNGGSSRSNKIFIEGGPELTGVRRLSPLECERLQGFPDGHTEGQSDAQRYRQLGNSVAIPVIEWITKRLVEVDKCGIGVPPNSSR